MTLSGAKKIAEQINGNSIAFDQRNVWLFYAMDEKDNDVIITKENAPVNRSGVFLGTPEGELLDAATGEAVPYEDIFGNPFFHGKPYLEIDNATSGNWDLSERIDYLSDEIQELLKKFNVSFATFIMVGDLAKGDEETAHKRLTVLYNYLSEYKGSLSVKEFAYIHHELFALN